MRELDNNEISNVNGAGFFYDVMYAIGAAMGAGAKNQKEIDKIGNEMLGAMQYGA